jgi:hypothetical protein
MPLSEDTALNSGPKCKKTILSVIVDAEQNLAEMELAKDDFAEAYRSRQFDAANHHSSHIYGNLKKFLEFFRYTPRRRRSRWFNVSPDFRKDARMRSLASTLGAIVVKVKKALDSVNLGDFLRYTDMANRHCYKILSRAEDLRRLLPELLNPIIKEEKEEEPKKQSTIRTSLRMRDNFNNWGLWIEEERRKEKEIEIEKESEFNDLIKQLKEDS